MSPENKPVQTEKRIRYVNPQRPRCGDDLEHPWLYALPPYRVAPHVWNVGCNDDVCAYLFDTGDGLLLLDTGYRASFYLLLQGIYKLGFKPEDIRIILLSHWHWDHVNGVRFLTAMGNPRVYLSREDEVCHQRYKDATEPLPMVDYTVTDFYDGTPIRLGRFSIEPVFTPGHTPGATSFFFTDTDDETGITYRCAMHGGLGVGLMHPDQMKVWNVPEELAHRFVRDCTELAERPVDIALPSHINQGNVLANLPEDLSDYTPWIADYAWRDCLINRADAVKKFYPDIYGIDS